MTAFSSHPEPRSDADRGPGPQPRKRPGSRKSAIDAFCRYCLYDPGAAGTWRQQVDACTALDCPLYSFRPRSKHGA